MAVEENEAGGAGTAGELLVRAELEMKKEREMGGEIEHIACRDGDDNDGSGTDGSFVMVMNGGDFDARSDSSEKDFDVDARGCEGGTGDLSAANSGFYTTVDYARVEEGEGDNGVERDGNEGEEARKLGECFLVESEGKGDDVGEGEDDALDGELAEKILPMRVELEEVVDECAKTDRAQKEEGAIDFKASTNEEENEKKETVVVEVPNDEKHNQVEEGKIAVKDFIDERDGVLDESDAKDEVVDIKDLKSEEKNQIGEEVMIVEDSKIVKDAIIEDLNNEDEAMANEDLKNEDQSQDEEEVVIVTDSKIEMEPVIKYLNKEDIMGTEEEVTGGTEISYAQSEVGSDNKGLPIGASSAQSSSSGPVSRNVESELLFKKIDPIDSAGTELVNEEFESVSEIDELKKSSEHKRGAVESSVAEIKEADSASEIEDRGDIDNEVSVKIDSSELSKEEFNSVSEIEDRRDDNLEECKDVDSSVRDADNKGVDSNLEVEESKTIIDEGINNVESAEVEISSVVDVEDRRDDIHEECDDVDSSVRTAAEKRVDSISEIEERERTINEEIKDVESEITDQMDDEVYSTSKVRDMGIACDDSSNYINWENEKNSDIQLDENLRTKTMPAVYEGEGGELNTSVEEVRQHIVNESLPNSEIEQREYDSSVELIDEPVKKNGGSAPIEEEGQVVEASSIGQSTEPAKESISSPCHAEVEYDEALSTGSTPETSNREWVSAPEADVDKNVEILFSVSNPEPRKDMDLAPIVEEKRDLDASFIDSNAEPSRLLASTSESGEIQPADAPFVGSMPEPLKEDIGTASKSEENRNAEALVNEVENEKSELNSATELADGVSKPVKALEEIEDKRKDLKADDRSVESSRTETANVKGEQKSATESTGNMKIYVEKNLGATKEQHKELKSEEKQDAVHFQQQEGNAAPSAPDVDGEKIEMPIKKYRLIKVPRLTQKVINVEHQAKITDAQVQVDEHTRRRDSLKAELDNMRKVLSDYFHKRDSANEDEKKAKALVNAKRLEMDSVQNVISKGKTASSFLEIISQIHALEHKMQHETISLKDEKKYLQELNQLKHERELHLFSKCSQLEIDEALKQKETAESSLRTLKKEFDTLRTAHLKAEEYSKVVSKSYIDQFNRIKEHEQKWKAANELRQNAYKSLHGLKSDKMEHYWKYMDDRQAAKKYASSRDIEALERHCTEQVERIMRLWNEDDDFRKQYVESNVSNILRKFGTLDGRTPGPNDPKPLHPSHFSPTSRSPAPITVREELPLRPHKVTKPALPTNPMARSKLPSKPTMNKVAAVDAPSVEEVVEVEVEKKLTKEEEEQARLAEELARKEEELRKIREELELKEKLRMEQKAKAKEAEERKRRKAEKAQAKAEYKAQKDAELRELKRSKKEKKKESSSEKAGSVEGDIASVTETASQEASEEQESNIVASSKKSRRRTSAALNKYSNKVQPVPLHLRNRGKKKMSTWIWTLCVAAALIGLFFAGNYISFSVSWLNFGF
ncbi:titin homolog [Phalaenopsis equestris]|uniref:titin homolog n=1 Tax=Phalaenopsis equestris TaxID=78828 RepID=UPI0009E26F76|nr:titin homolog [Phalaenopsis equestris]